MRNRFIYKLFAVIMCLTMLLSSFTCLLVNGEEADGGAVFGEITKEDIYSAVYEASISELRKALDLGFITSRELTQLYLDRYESFGKDKKVFITLCDNALSEADKRDELIKSGEGKGSLLGIPVVVKDNLHYIGYPTTNGFKKDGSISDINADAVQYLLNEGAVVLGKTNMSTEAQEAKATVSQAVGETTNAYSFGMASGGSSGGSAVSVSLNIGAAGLGTDTNSSLRYPAALNGCVSLRPSFDLVSRNGCITLNKKRDVVGAITKTVLDQAIMLDAITGGQYSFAQNLDENALNGAKIGIIKQLSYASSGDRAEQYTDKEVQTAFAQAAEELRSCGAEVIEVSFPKVFSLSDDCYYTKPEQVNKFYAAYEKLFTDNGLDAVIYPTYVTTPQEKGKIYQTKNVQNCRTISPPMGVPEIEVQIGYHSMNAGIGMEIAGLKGDDGKLLSLAYSYTQKFDHRRVPDYAENTFSGNYTMSQIFEEYERYLNPPESEPATDADKDNDKPVTVTDKTQKNNGKEKNKLLYVFTAVGVVLVVLTIAVPYDKKRKR